MFPEKHRKSRNRREETPTEGIFRPRKCIFGRLTLNFCLIQVNGSLLRVVFPGIGPLEPIVRITYLRGLRAPRGKPRFAPPPERPLARPRSLTVIWRAIVVQPAASTKRDRSLIRDLHRRTMGLFRYQRRHDQLNGQGGLQLLRWENNEI